MQMDAPMDSTRNRYRNGTGSVSCARGREPVVKSVQLVVVVVVAAAVELLEVDRGSAVGRVSIDQLELRWAISVTPSDTVNESLRRREHAHAGAKIDDGKRNCDGNDNNHNEKQSHRDYQYCQRLCSAMSTRWHVYVPFILRQSVTERHCENGSE
jgi:hypothetical protein